MKYKAPSDEIFNEMKQAAIDVWKTYDDTHGYASEKINKVNSITNIQDNAMVFYRMFDHFNQAKMKRSLSEKSIDYIQHNQ